METTDIFDLSGTKGFWTAFQAKFPDFDTSGIWYEVFIDFTGFHINTKKSLEWNLNKAKKYLDKHRNDYEDFDKNTGLFIQ